MGRDAAGGALTADLAARGLPLRGVLRPPGAATATVSIVFDGAGEVAQFCTACCSFLLRSQWDCTESDRSTAPRLLQCQLQQQPGVLSAPARGLPPLRLQVAAAVADVLALERALTPGALTNEFSHDIAAAPLVVIDTNLSPAALRVSKRCKPSRLGKL